VLLTSNNTRELSEALKRRCLYLHVDYPTPEIERQIVSSRVPGMPPKLAQQAVDLVQRLRTMDLKKHPSVSETIDWARALVAMNVRALDKQTLETTMNVLLKYESDLQKARRALGRDEAGEGGRPDQGERGRDRRRPRDLRDSDEWRN
jgi:MoxR-like ATPase